MKFRRLTIGSISVGCAFTMASLFLARAAQIQHTATQDWTMSGGSPGNTHYSPLAQIDRAHVASLEQAWSFDTKESGGRQTSPTIVDGVLYGITPTQKVFA